MDCCGHALNLCYDTSWECVLNLLFITYYITYYLFVILLQHNKLIYSCLSWFDYVFYTHMQLSLIVATHLGMNLAPKVSHVPRFRCPGAQVPRFPLVLETRDLSLRFLLRCLGSSVTIGPKWIKKNSTFVSERFTRCNNGYKTVTVEWQCDKCIAKSALCRSDYCSSPALNKGDYSSDSIEKRGNGLNNLVSRLLHLSLTVWVGVIVITPWAIHFSIRLRQPNP